ncbi:hypothetical protein GCM10027299_09730 [Larkinella ripae]
MKIIFNTLLVALTLTAASFNAANASPKEPKKAAAFQSGLYTTIDGKLQIAVNKEVGNAVMVRLLDAKGKEVFVQQIGKRQQAVRLRLDVSDLPDGIYQVAISNGAETTVKEVSLATQQAPVAPRFVAVN